MVGLCRLFRASASPDSSLANNNTMTHIPILRFVTSSSFGMFPMLMLATGSRRTRQGFLQVRMGARQVEGRA